MAGDASYASVGLLLHGRGADGNTTIIDNSNPPRTITVNGSAKISTAQHAFASTSSALSFDGSSAYLSVSGTDLANVPGNLTVECWAYLTGTPATAQDLVGTNRSVSPTNGWVLRRQSDGHITFEGSTTGSNSFAASGPSVPSTGAWHHFAGVLNGSALTLFIDGVPGTPVSMSGAQYNTASNVIVGRNATNASWYFNGHLADVRVTNGVARYTAAFTPPTAPFPDGMGQVSGTVTDSASAACARIVRAYRRDTGALVASAYSNASDANYNYVVLLLHGGQINSSLSITDSGLQAHGITVTGDTKLSTSQSKFSGGSIFFDGAGDYLSLPSNADFNLPGDFTLEGWVYLTTLTPGIQTVLARKSLLASPTTGEWAVLFNQTTGALDFATTVNNFFTFASGDFTTGAWHHWAVVRSGTTVKAYKDGEQSTNSFTIATDYTNSRTLEIGRWDSVPTVMTGYQDELRITKGVARYAAGFSVPTDRFANRASGALGDYSFYTPTLGEVEIIVLDDDAGTLQNDLIARVIPA